MAKETLTVPDIGGAEDAEVIEIYVSVGDQVEPEQSLIALESDKASMEIPSEQAGTVVELLVKTGDNLAEGGAILVLETAGAASADSAAEPAAGEPAAGEPAAGEPAAELESEQQQEPEPEPEPAEVAVSESVAVEQNVVVPDLGTPDAVEVIEIMVAPGDTIAEGDSLLVLESDKASMEIPAPFAGVLVSLAVGQGSEVCQGDVIGIVRGLEGEAADAAVTEPAPDSASPPAVAPAPGPVVEEAAVVSAASADGETGATVYAGPAVRKLAREFGVDLTAVKGSGPRHRILKEDLQSYVKNSLKGSAPVAAAGTGIPPIPAVDFAAFGEVDIQPLTKMDKLTAANMQRSWLNVPHVTQFDDADVTDMETFRGELKAEAAQRGVKLTPLPFLLKACATALKDNPRLNASLAADGENIVYKHYVNIGMAVATPAGLLVPVIRDVDKKNLWELAAETAELAQKAKERKLKPNEMQGGCFTISSLGGIGGIGFTPIVNAPEVAILGVSKLAVKPVWNGEEFEPRKLLPLALSYDHRTVNGADGGGFLTQVVSILADIRRLLL